MFFHQKFIENWINRELKSIIKKVHLSFICNNYNCFLRSGRNSSIEPVADLIVKRILKYNEKIFFLSLKYIFNYPNPQLSQLIINYALFKVIIKN